jgi:hypothetical protein
VNVTGSRPRLRVGEDVGGLVGRVGTRLVAEVADRTGLTGGLIKALDPGGRQREHQSGRVAVDIAVGLVDGATCIEDRCGGGDFFLPGCSSRLQFSNPVRTARFLSCGDLVFADKSGQIGCSQYEGDCSGRVISPG